MSNRQLTPLQSEAVTVCGIATLFVTLAVAAQFVLWITTSSPATAELSIGVGFVVALASFIVANTNSARTSAALCLAFVVALPLLAVVRALTPGVFPAGFAPHAADIALAAGLYASLVWLYRRAFATAPAVAGA